MYAKFTYRLISLLTACFGASAIMWAEQNLTSASVRGFYHAGSSAEVVRRLARATYLKGVLGFENLDGTVRAASMPVAGDDVGAVLRSICSADHRYRTVETDSPLMLNVLASDVKTPGHEILDFRIPQLDIETDELPNNLIAKLPFYSPPLMTYLRGIFLRDGGRDDPNVGSPGSGMRGNANLPHFSIHLTNASVREALNAIAIQSFRMYEAIGVDPRMASTPDQLRVIPTGWEFRLLDPHGIPFQSWVWRLFAPLQ